MVVDEGLPNVDCESLDWVAIANCLHLISHTRRDGRRRRPRHFTTSQYTLAGRCASRIRLTSFRRDAIQWCVPATAQVCRLCCILIFKWIYIGDEFIPSRILSIKLPCKSIMEMASNELFVCPRESTPPDSDDVQRQMICPNQVSV